MGYSLPSLGSSGIEGSGRRSRRRKALNDCSLSLRLSLRVVAVAADTADVDVDVGGRRFFAIGTSLHLGSHFVDPNILGGPNNLIYVIN